MKPLLTKLLRVSGIFVLVSMGLMCIGVFLQAQKVKIDMTVSSQRFESLMRMYYLGTTMKEIAAWMLLISLTVGIIAGILYILRRLQSRRRTQCRSVQQVDNHLRRDREPDKYWQETERNS